MRRKVLQDYINGFCTYMAQEPADICRILYDGLGHYLVDILENRTERNGQEVEPLRVIDFYCGWLNRRACIDHIDVGQLRSCVLEFDVDILSLEIVTLHFPNRTLDQAAARLSISCAGRIETDEKTYSAKRVEAANISQVVGRPGHCESMVDLLEKYPFATHRTFLSPPDIEAIG